MVKESSVFCLYLPLGPYSMDKVLPTLRTMAEVGMVLCVHGEVTDADVDVFDREGVFIRKILDPLMHKVPGLKASRQCVCDNACRVYFNSPPIKLQFFATCEDYYLFCSAHPCPCLQVVLEHVTTKDAVDFVTQGGERVAASITPQHILMNRNALFQVTAESDAREIFIHRPRELMFWLTRLPPSFTSFRPPFALPPPIIQGGLRPHCYCLPVLKRELHREAVSAAAMSGSPQFFLGTDSAPHPK